MPPLPVVLAALLCLLAAPALAYDTLVLRRCSRDLLAGWGLQPARLLGAAACLTPVLLHVDLAAEAGLPACATRMEWTATPASWHPGEVLQRSAALLLSAPSPLPLLDALRDGSWGAAQQGAAPPHVKHCSRSSDLQLQGRLHGGCSGTGGLFRAGAPQLLLRCAAI